MASWMVHLRIADKLLTKLSDLIDIEFVVGNMAPDSGVPNADGSAFIPSGDISHFKTTDADGLKDIHLHKYVERFFTEAQRKQYDSKQNSFYLGYLTHLLTDIMWVDSIVRPSISKFKPLYDKDRKEWNRILKKDWYDLDYLYIKKNPNFRAFSIYSSAVGFENKYIDFFRKDAFHERREYIVSFYSKENNNSDRDYIYLTENEMDRFVYESVDNIYKILLEDYL